MRQPWKSPPLVEPRNIEPRDRAWPNSPACHGGDLLPLSTACQPQLTLTPHARDHHHDRTQPEAVEVPHREVSTASMANRGAAMGRLASAHQSSSRTTPSDLRQGRTTMVPSDTSEHCSCCSTPERASRGGSFEQTRDLPGNLKLAPPRHTAAS